MPKKSIAKPLIELSLASICWGFGFVGTVWCLQTLSAPAILFYRFAIAGALGVLVLAARRTPWLHWWYEIKISFVAGFLLAATLILQTYGLAGTSPTKSAFITTTYVVMVPVLGHFLNIEKIQWLHWCFVGLAILGAFLTLNVSLSGWHAGELLTCANALMASLHILWMGKSAPQSRSPMAFNTFQSLAVCLWLAPFALWTEHWDVRQMDHRAIWSLLILGVGASFLAFMMQVRAQQQLSPSVASLLFLLESPLSFLFSFFLLGELLVPSQVVGLIVILGACLGSIWASSRVSQPPQPTPGVP